MPSHPPHVRLRVLGSAEILGTTRPPSGAPLLGGAKRLALVVHLALGPTRGFVSRDTLFALLWPELDDAHARVALNKAVHEIRTALGREIVLRRGEGEVALDRSRFRCDAASFERMVAAGDLERALRIYRGHLLPGFHLPGATEFQDWLEARRLQLREMAVDAAVRLITPVLMQNDPEAALRWARRAIELDPCDERAVRFAMELLDASGQRAAAIESYRRLARRLEREYELTPSASTHSLAHRLMGG